MLITRINPDWTWPRAKDVFIFEGSFDLESVVTDVTDVTAISYTPAVKTTTPHEKPALHRSLMRAFAQYLDDGDEERMITKWYQDHGPLTIDGTVESFLDEASIVWWTVTVLDRFGGIGAYSNEKARQRDMGKDRFGKKEP